MEVTVIEHNKAEQAGCFGVRESWVLGVGRERELKRKWRLMMMEAWISDISLSRSSLPSAFEKGSGHSTLTLSEIDPVSLKTLEEMLSRDE